MARIIRAFKTLFSSYDPYVIWNEWNTVRVHAKKQEHQRRQRQMQWGMISSEQIWR